MKSLVMLKLSINFVKSILTLLCINIILYFWSYTWQSLDINNVNDSSWQHKEAKRLGTALAGNARTCDGSHAIGKAPFDSWPRDEICDQAVAEQRWFITLILWLITWPETDFRQWRCFNSNNKQVAIYIVVLSAYLKK